MHVEHAERASLARAPSRFERVGDRVFRHLTRGFAWLAVVLMALIVYEIGGAALPAVQQHGWRFVTSRTWDVNKGQYGVLPEIWGTLYSSCIALVVGGLFGVAVAVFLTQYFLPPAIEVILKNIIELLAAIPSVVYGMWGLFVVIPVMRPPAAWLHSHLGWFPLFGTPFNGPGLLPAALVLSIMILPTITAVSRDALGAVPRRLKEASFGLGATRWETILGVIVPTASTGIFGALVLGFGRALGETMALAMLIGNSNQISLSIFAPANTLASLLANSFPEAGEQETPVLMYAALVLMLITLTVNVLGTVVLNRTSSRAMRGSVKA